MDVLSSAEFIASQSDDVTVDVSQATWASQAILEGMTHQKYDVTTWGSHPLNPKGNNPSDSDWVFLVDSLNFSFWSDSPSPFTVKYLDTSYTGYWSLCAAVNRAVAEGIPLLDPRFCHEELTLETFQRVFRSETEEQIPFLNERFQLVKENAAALVQKYNGSFRHVLEKAGKSAERLIELVLESFPSFRDVGEYKGKQVRFLKRAQILVGDLWGCFAGQGLGEFTDIDKITMFADYRVPQALLSLKILKYSEKLNERLQRRDLFISGEPTESEIRGCSIWAVEVIRRTLVEMLKQRGLGETAPNAILIDFYLWDYAKKHHEDIKDWPIHRIRTIFY